MTFRTLLTVLGKTVGNPAGYRPLPTELTLEYDIVDRCTLSLFCPNRANPYLKHGSSGSCDAGVHCSVPVNIGQLWPISSILYLKHGGCLDGCGHSEHCWTLCTSGTFWLNWPDRYLKHGDYRRPDTGWTLVNSCPLRAVLAKRLNSSK